MAWDAYPKIQGRIHVFNSAVSIFYSPSNICGITGMWHEHIQATPSWRKGCACYDTILVNSDFDVAGVHGFEVGACTSFFSFHFSTMTKIIPVPWFSGIHMWALNLMKTQGFGWSNWTQTTMVIHTLPLFILIQSIELFISCQHIKTTCLLSILLQCIHHLIHLSSFISTISWEHVVVILI